VPNAANTAILKSRSGFIRTDALKNRKQTAATLKVILVNLSFLNLSNDENQRAILFAVFVGIFCVTAIITLLGITGKLKIREGYLKALFSALILQVIGIIIALAKTTLTPTSPEEYQVWTVMGKMDLSHSHLSPSGVPTVAIEVLPQPAMDSNGIFSFYVAAPRTNGAYALPTVRFVDPGAQQLRDIQLDPKWDKYSEVKIDRDVKIHTATISPFLLTPVSVPAGTDNKVQDASAFRSSGPLNIATGSNATSASTPSNHQ